MFKIGKEYVFDFESYNSNMKDLYVGFIAKETAELFDGEPVFVLSESTAILDGGFYVNYNWCREVK